MSSAMKRTIVYYLVILMALQSLALSSCQMSTKEPPTPTPPATTTPHLAAMVTSTPWFTPTPDPGDDLNRRVELILSQMTPEEKVGQLFAISFDGTSATPELEHAVRDLHVGGVLLFSANVSSLLQLRAVVTQSQEMSVGSGARIPLFIGIDHEGGIITRLGEHATEFPSNMAVGATRSVGNADSMAAAMASELQAIGVNMTLGPALDVNTDPANPVIGTRSFGSDPDLVTEMGLAMVERYQQRGMIAVVKHFPGHGDTGLDSHFSLPTLDVDRQRLDAVELRPFRAGVSAGVDAIMTAHIAVPALDERPAHPATLSAPILTGLLRQEWGFDGLIATDSLGMGAVDDAFGMEKAAVLAFQAGADLLMFGWDALHALPDIYAAYDAVLELVQTAPAAAEPLDQSVSRILRTKAKWGILDWRPPSAPIAETVRTPEHLLLARQVARDSVTLVRDDAQVLPLRPETRLLLIYPQGVPKVEAALRAHFSDLHSLPVHRNPEDSEIRTAVEKATEAEAVVIATLDAMTFPSQADMVQVLAGQARPIVVVALRSPYDLLMFPQQSTYVAIYGETPRSLEAMSELLCGEIQPRGLLPVDLPGLYPFGHGLTQFTGSSIADTPPAGSSD
jgi:beta-N-acetylhexosaminidase